jgi:lysophospholipase L1-like esterase
MWCITSIKRKLLYLSLAFNLLVLLGGMIVLQKVGGIKYLLIRLERANNGLEYEDMVSQYALLPDKPNEIIFLGNSIIFRGQWAELFNDRCINRGIGGDDTDRILLRLDEIVMRKPDKIFIMDGINDLGKNRSISYIMSNYQKMIDKLSKETPNSKLYLQSVLPINNQIRNHRRTNDEIKALNTEIEKLAKAYDATYIDLFTPFLNKAGMLNEELTTDGIHINGNGYQLWRNSIYHYVVDEHPNLLVVN